MTACDARLPAGAMALVAVMLALPPALAQASSVTFAPATSTDVGAIDPRGVAVADFNQDGHLDLVVTPVRIIAGDGTGSLGSGNGVPFPDAAGVAAADFNGDGALDLAITQGLVSKSYGDGFCGNLIGVGIFLGPNLTFRSCLIPGIYPIAVQAGDFDRDGRMDLAVVSHLGGGLRIYKGSGDGTFVQFADVPGLNATKMAPPVDLNADGFVDLVVSHAAGVSTFLGNGNGTFRIGGSAGGAQDTQAVAVGDLNADGVPDIASVESTNGRLLVGFGRGDGTFPPVTAIATIGSDLSDVAIADIDHDGRPDIVVAHKGAGTIRIFFGNGNGTFVENPPLAISVKPKFLAVRDWDEDGDLDLGIVDTSVDGQLNAKVWIAQQNGRGPLDVALPTVALTSPAPGSRVSGTVGVTATASDNVGVTRVEFFAGGTLIGKSAGPSFVVSWNTAALPNGPVTLTARAFDATHNASQPATLQVTVGNASPIPMSYYTLEPCRVADTRSAQAPALGANTTRRFPVAGLCGVPVDAKAVAVVLTTVDQTDSGDLRLFPAGATQPLASAINFGVGRARANNAVVPLGAFGQVDIRCDMAPSSSGTTHFLLDVSGYFK